MDDLNGLDWNSTTSKTKSTAPQGTGNYYSSIPSLRPTPPPQSSGRSTPLSNHISGTPKPFAPPKSSTPDSFSNLVSFGSSKQNTLTLQEQQVRLQEERRRQEEEKKRQYESQYGGTTFWDGLGNGRTSSATNTPPITSRSATPAAQPLSFKSATRSTPTLHVSGASASAGDNDLFAAFNKDTQVDNSTHFPPRPGQASGRGTPSLASKESVDLIQPQAWGQPPTLSANDFGDDDDLFGLGQSKMVSALPAPIPTLDEDDFLGDLGKPVNEVKRSRTAVKPPTTSEPTLGPEADDPWDNAVAELVDMGFSAEQSRRALTESGSGLDIQAAVGWILNDAHKSAKQKQQSRATSQDASTRREQRNTSQDRAKSGSVPPWMTEARRESSQTRHEADQSSSSELDISKSAAAVGNNLFKTANSLWKTSQKKVQRAVADFQQDVDPSQPKWMREAAEREAKERSNHLDRHSQNVAVLDVTDEALMLEAGGRPPPRKSKQSTDSRPSQELKTSRNQPPALSTKPHGRDSPVPRWQQSATVEPKSRISKQAIEEQSAQAYISPARRKKTTPIPAPSPQLEPEFLSSSSAQPFPPSLKPSQRSTATPSKPSTPTPTRPKAPARQIPTVSNIALQSSTQHRIAGTQHFKRGDYASAHSSYSSSLSALPERHPITIILLCNRALTGLKTGVPREAVLDADTALSLIGISRGDGETIDLGASEGGGVKDMKEFYGKALTRKAEALEQMEKWGDARDVWKIAVEHGVGGSNALQGRTRCEKAMAPKPTPRAATPQARPKPAPRPKNSALSDLGGNSGGDSEAVQRLRAQNRQAERADDEKFALADIVDEKVGKWRDGKRDNLRALIGSLDTVMWEGAGWKKVGMHELVSNGKVKINYMKAIGKCHPDKLPQDASTEVRMIAALVFATLNESWDKFKQQNGM